MTTAPRLVIIITHAGRDPGAVTLGFLTASAALAAGRRAAVLLRGEGVLCATAEGWAATLHEAGYPPLREVRDAYREAGGALYLSQPCLQRYWLSADHGLLPGVRVLSIAEMADFCIGATTLVF
jgi:predicted peroxiredoxin